jgi:ketosteroid isomerase-like protein
MVVRRYYAVLAAKDADAAAALLADGVERIGILGPDVEPRITKGKDHLIARIRLMIDDNAEVEAREFHVAGNRVTCIASVATDTIRSEGVAPLEETAEFIVVDGKIQSYRVTLTSESIAKLKAAGLS